MLSALTLAACLSLYPALVLAEQEGAPEAAGTDPEDAVLAEADAHAGDEDEVAAAEDEEARAEGDAAEGDAAEDEEARAEGDAAEDEEARAEDATGGEAEAAPAEAVATDPAVIETPEAEEDVAPVAEETVATEPAVAEAADDEADPEEDRPGKPWSLTAGHNFGFGLQIDEATHYYYGQISVSGSYRIHGALSARASAGLHYTPNPRPRDARRLDVGGVSLGVAHGNLFHEETFTDIRVSGSATVALPVSMGGRAMANYPTVGAGVTLARSVGPVNFTYGVNFNKFNPKSNVRYLPLCAEDRGGIQYCVGSYETNWQLGHRFGASYRTPVDGLSVSANFGTTLTRTFGPSRHDPAMSPEYMHHVRANVRDGFGFGLSASYRLPVDGLSTSLSFSNGGTWRSNGQDLYNPLFDPRLAAMSVGVSYTY